MPLEPSGFGNACAGGPAAPHNTSHHVGGNDALDLASIAGAITESQHGTPAGDLHPSYALDADLAAHEAAADPHAVYQRESEKAAALGYASLDAATKVPIAQLPLGSTSSTVAVGNDARLSDARTPTAHKTSHQDGGADELSVAGLSGLLADAQTALSHTHVAADITGTAVLTGDARLSDARTPTAHKTSHENGGADEISVAGLSGVLGDLQVAGTVRTTTGPTDLVVGAVADGEFLKRVGATVVGAAAGGGNHAASHQNAGGDEISVAGLSGLLADAQTPLAHVHVAADVTGTAVLTADARLSDARTPLAHAASHKSGGSDTIKLDELAAPTDITTLNATTALHGLLRKLDGLTTTFLRGDGTWAAPTAAAADPAYAPGSFTLATGTFRVQVRRLTLTSSQRATLQGTARMRELS